MNLIKPFTAILPQGYISSKSIFFFFFLPFSYILLAQRPASQTTHIDIVKSQPALQSPSSQKILVGNQISMSQKQIDSHAANRLETLTIWSLLPARYHYDLQVTDNSKIYPCFAFNFGRLPKGPHALYLTLT